MTSGSPQISIIIPTFKRLDKLTRLLLDLQEQTFPLDQLEVFIVDDGSPEDAADELARLPLSYRFQYLHLPPGGPAKARNRALERAAGEYVLFLNDDARADRQLVDAHLAAHRIGTEPVAVLGAFAFSDELRQDMFCRVLEDTQLIITTRPLVPGGRYTYRAFWTGNLSVPRGAVDLVGRFDESFPEPSHEDLDLGIRLEQQLSMRVIYNPLAKCDHDHRQNPLTWFRQNTMGGRNGYRMYRKHGRLNNELSALEEEGRLSVGRLEAARAKLSQDEPVITQLHQTVEKILAAPAGRLAGRVDLGQGHLYQLPQDAEAAVQACAKLLARHYQLLGFVDAALEDLRPRAQG